MTETEILDVHHPKLEAFQLAVKTSLLKRIREADEEIARLNKESSDKTKAKEEQTRKLHDSQRELKQEQQNLAETERELFEIREERVTLEAENQIQEKRIDDLKTRFLRAKGKNEHLKETQNRVLAQQICLTARRVKTAGDVNATQTSASKIEEDFKLLQMEKQAQDLYVDKLSQEMEDMEQKVIEYEEQANTMRQQTEETKEMVRQSEAEIENVRQEKRNIMQNWTSTVINIAKRDEALVSFRTALKNQELNLKGVKAQIEGTKQEIIGCQEKHDHLTTIIKRAQRMSANRRAQIRKTNELIDDTKVDLEEAQKAKEKTLETLQKAQLDVEDVVKDVEGAKYQIGKLEEARREMEDKVWNLSREQLASDKYAGYTAKNVRIVREKTKILEQRLSDTRNQMSAVLQNVMQQSVIVGREKENKRIVEQELSNLHRELQVVEKALNQAQAAIDRKQNEIDIKSKAKTEIEEANKGAALSPLEADLERTRAEIEAVQEYCQEAKEEWLKYQNQFIKNVEIQSDTSQLLGDTTTKYRVMQEKHQKLQAEIIALEKYYTDLKRKLEAKGGLIRRMNRQFYEEKARYDEQVKSIESCRADEVNKMQLLLDQVEAIKDQVKQLGQEIEIEKINSTEAADDLSAWEERIRSCKETQTVLNQEKGREAELDMLRRDVHRMQLRAEEVDRQTKMVMGAIEDFVDRRDALVDKAITLATSRQQNTTPQTIKSLLGKKIEDAKFKLRKMMREENVIKRHLAASQERCDVVRQQFGTKQALLIQLQQSIAEIVEQMDQKWSSKDVKLNMILHLQTRARWYKAIKEKKYRPAHRDEAQSATELSHVQAQNDELRNILKILMEEFPHLKRNITKAINLIV